MAEATVARPNAGSNLVSGNGTNRAVFTLPGSPHYLIESVVATVNNSAGGDTTATLTMADTNGAVIAKRRQGETIDAAATTTATWALRLVGSGGASTASGFIRYDVANVGNLLDVTANGGFMWQTNGAGWLVDLGGGGMQLDTNGGGFITQTDGGGYSIATGGGGYTLQTDGGGILLTDFEGTVTMRAAALQIRVDFAAGIIASILSGKPFEIRDALGDPIFRVDENGDLHGKTGASLVFDL